MKRKTIILLFVVIAAIFYLAYDSGNLGSMTGKTTNSIELGSGIVPNETSKDPIVIFCPSGNCGENLLYLINNSKKIHCAFFEINEKNLVDALKEKGAQLVVDADYYNENLSFARKDTRKAYMHDKFCIFDDHIVMTGSFNPTYAGDMKNDNDMIILDSKYLAENYESEFQELWNGEFGKGSNVRYPKMILNGNNVENYFCPEDWCANKIMDVLGRANKSIYFMTFSFTHDKIGDLLVEKHKQGVEIKGIMEKSQKSQYSEYDRLKNASIDVQWDKNPALMHLKVFIIDNETVITGSFNPSLNADTRNDENIIIVYNKKLASLYMAEFMVLMPNKA